MPAQSLRFPSALLLLALAACSGAKGKAEEALAGAEQKVTAASAEARQVLPAEVERLERKLTEARDSLTAGSYDAVVAASVAVSADIDSLTARVPAKRVQLAAELDTLRFAVQQNLAAIQKKLTEFDRTRRLPRDLDAAKLAEVKATVAQGPQDWEQVEAEIKSGNLAGAFGRATELRVKISNALTAVGLSAGETAWHNLTLPPG